MTFACLKPFKKKDGTLVPCGVCSVCARRRSDQWAFRIKKDMEFCKKKCACQGNKHGVISDNYYITLTYNNQYLPVDYYVEGDDNKVVRLKDDSSYSENDGILWRADVVNFNKRLRVHLERKFGIEGIRIAYSGEYGPNSTHRPHFHLFIWNCSLSLKKMRKAVNRCWSFFDRCTKRVDPIGHTNVQIPRVPKDCASYVTKSISYVLKEGTHFYCKRPGEKLINFIERTGKKTAPFLGFSKGIGQEYVEKNAHTLSCYGYCPDGSYIVSLPRYYKEKLIDMLGKTFYIDQVNNKIRRLKLGYFSAEEVDIIADYFFAVRELSELRKDFRLKYQSTLGVILTENAFKSLCKGGFYSDKDGYEPFVITDKMQELIPDSILEAMREFLDYDRFYQAKIVELFNNNCVQRYLLNLVQCRPSEKDIVQAGKTKLSKMKLNAEKAEERKLKCSVVCFGF